MDTPEEEQANHGKLSARISGGVALSNMKLSGLRRITLAATGLALASGAFLGGIKTANATPSTLGFYPSTDFYGKGTIHYDADVYTRTNLSNTVINSNGLTYGVGPDKEGLFGRTELGFDYNFTAGASVDFDQRIFGNAKTQLYNNDKSQTRLVLGGWGLGDTSLNPNYIYLLGSKTFDFGRFHLGVAHGLTKGVFQTFSKTGTSDKGRTSVQLGYDKYITPKLQFAVDYYSGKGFDSGVQPTLYYYVNDKADFGLGYFRQNEKFPTRNQLYLCFDYNFDLNKTTVVTPTPTPETAPAAPATN